MLVKPNKDSIPSMLNFVVEPGSKLQRNTIPTINNSARKLKPPKRKIITASPLKINFITYSISKSSHHVMAKKYRLINDF